MILTNKKFRKYMDEICNALIGISNRLSVLEGKQAPKMGNVFVCQKCGKKTYPYVMKKQINQFNGYQYVLVCDRCGSPHLEVCDERNTNNSDGQ